MSIKSEIYRYLEMTEGHDRAVDNFVATCMAIEFPGKYLYRIFDYEETSGAIQGYRSFDSQSLKTVLKGAKQVVVFAATLGADFDRILERMKYDDGMNMMIMNAYGSAKVEALVDDMVLELQESLGGYQTPRFSPGYGDFDLSFQRDIGRLIRLDRIGITLTESHLMAPAKSITGIIGLSDQPLQGSYDVCDSCLRRTLCNRRICRRVK